MKRCSGLAIRCALALSLALGCAESTGPIRDARPLSRVPDGCVPRGCAELACGVVPDGCGTLLDCRCDGSQSDAGSQDAAPGREDATLRNDASSPATCVARTSCARAECGRQAPDGCGGTLDCGECSCVAFEVALPSFDLDAIGAVHLGLERDQITNAPYLLWSGDSVTVVSPRSTRRPGELEWWAARYALDGRSIDPEPFQLTEAVRGASVIWTGTSYLVTYVEPGGGIRVRRVLAGGALERESVVAAPEVPPGVDPATVGWASTARPSLHAGDARVVLLFERQWLNRLEDVIELDIVARSLSWWGTPESSEETQLSIHAQLEHTFRGDASLVLVWAAPSSLEPRRAGRLSLDTLEERSLSVPASWSERPLPRILGASFDARDEAYVAMMDGLDLTSDRSLEIVALGADGSALGEPLIIGPPMTRHSPVAFVVLDDGTTLLSIVPTSTSGDASLRRAPIYRLTRASEGLLATEVASFAVGDTRVLISDVEVGDVLFLSQVAFGSGVVSLRPLGQTGERPFELRSNLEVVLEATCL